MTKKRIPNYRKMYCEYHGLKEIPKGYHIHHKNGRRLDNSKENLILLTASEHMSLHARHRKKVKKPVMYSSFQMSIKYGLPR